jgi:hypothetical protein
MEAATPGFVRLLTDQRRGRSLAAMMRPAAAVMRRPDIRVELRQLHSPSGGLPEKILQNPQVSPVFRDSAGVSLQ